MVGRFLDDLISRALLALERAEIEFAVCGGVAMVASGRERGTRDLDVLVSFAPGDLERLKAQARQEGFSHHDRADCRQLEGLILYRFWLPVGDTDLSGSLDVQHGQTDFSREVVARARPVQMRGKPVPVATPEDLILLKLSAYRLIDQADAVELLRIHSQTLDQAYLESWADRLALAPRLRETRARLQDP